MMNTKPSLPSVSMQPPSSMARKSGMWRASCVGDSVGSLSIAVWSVDGRRRTPTLGAQAVHSGSPLFSGQAGSGESDLPGEGLGSKTEPVTDKLSALIEVMNEKLGADLDESDKLVFEQTRMDIMRREAK
ncbi:MAG: hypothetical protein E6875_04350 [Cutibacterium granulosum]|nr:hypothetical protein [Cutibacterium granulosum]